MTGVWWRTQAAVKWYIIITPLSRNFFTDLRKASVDIPKPPFASSISQSANDFFSLFFIKKKKLGEWTSIQWSKVTLLFSLTGSVDFFMLSPHSKPAFLALIPPFFTSLNSFVTFFRPLQPPILAVTTGESMKFPGSTPMLSVIYRKCSHANKPCTRNQVDSE